MTGATVIDGPSARPSAALTRTRLRWYISCGLVGALLGGGLAAAVTPLLPTTYVAESQLVIRSPGEVTVFGSAASPGVATVSLSAAQVMRSHDVAAEASDLLDGRLSPSDVAEQVTVTTGEISPVVTVEAVASSPELAKELADAVPAAFVEVESRIYRQRARQAAVVLGDLREEQQDELDDVLEEMEEKTEDVRAAAPPLPTPADTANYVRATLETDVEYQRLRNEAATLTARISETDRTIRQTDADFSILGSGVARIIDAELPAGPSWPTPAENVLMGALVGGLLGAGVAWWAIQRRRAVDAAVAAAALGAPLLGHFGPDRQLRRFPRFADLSGDSTAANELKVLAASLLLSARRSDVGVVVITSARSREGKSTLAANIAAAGEHAGHRVALVDAGTSSPTLSEAFALQDRPGLSEVLDGGPLADSLHLLPYLPDHTLTVLPGGVSGWRTEPGKRLSPARMAAWSSTFSGRDGLTAIVDVPAVNDHPLPLQLGGTGVLVVVVSPRTTVTDLEVLRNRADVAEVPLAGFVLNEFRSRRSRRLRRRRNHPRPVAGEPEDTPDPSVVEPSGPADPAQRGTSGSASSENSAPLAASESLRR